VPLWPPQIALDLIFIVPRPTQMEAGDWVPLLWQGEFLLHSLHIKTFPLTPFFISTILVILHLFLSFLSYSLPYNIFVHPSLCLSSHWFSPSLNRTNFYLYVDVSIVLFLSKKHLHPRYFLCWLLDLSSWLNGFWLGTQRHYFSRRDLKRGINWEDANEFFILFFIQFESAIRIYIP
jgi:hypothetical protein